MSYNDPNVNYPRPIDVPQRNISYLRDPSMVPKFWHGGSRYHDDRELGARKVRFEWDKSLDPCTNDPYFKIYTPEDDVIEVDSADDIKQNYVMHNFSTPDSGGLLRAMVDPVHKILVTYHFDRINLRWVKMVTRLRKDVEIVRPPANQLVSNAQYNWRSRGRRYLRKKPQVLQLPYSHSSANRAYYGKSGTSGSESSIGEFRSVM